MKNRKGVSECDNKNNYTCVGNLDKAVPMKEEKFMFC